MYANSLGGKFWKVELLNLQTFSKLRDLLCGMEGII